MIKHCIYLFFIVFLSNIFYAQKLEKTLNDNFDTSIDNKKNNDSKKIANSKDAVIYQYKIISHKRDTIYVDTTLSVKKDYKFNYLRKDNFGLIPFSNIGQTYNSISKDLSKNTTLPLFGSRARHFNYMEINDINYFHMPTPFTELFFKTAFQQGQVLDALFSVNTSPQFNFSIAYKGLRSLGTYQHILTSTGNFRFTSNFQTKNKKYNIRTHVVTQDLLNQENGGIKNENIENFTSGDEEFIDRAVFDPQFENAENLLRGKRFYLDHEFVIKKSIDSLANNSSVVGHVLYFEDKYYQFDQTRQNDFFGDAFVNSIVDRTTLEDFYNRIYVNYNHQNLGKLQLNLDYSDYNYGYNSVTVLDNNVLPNRIKGNTLAIGAEYEKRIGKLFLSGEVLANISGQFDGINILANANYKLNDDLNIIGSLKINSTAPNFNYLLYKSDYISYNWNNIQSFKNVDTKQLSFYLESSKIANIEFDFSNVENYSFFARTNEIEGVKPFQSPEQINYYKIKFNKEIKLGKFALDNTIMYQDVLDGETILNVPDFITRNTFYYSNDFFKKALFLQTGITFNYFTEYNMDAYDPLLAEFYTQNSVKIGNFPRLDFFVNAKIRQTRIFLKAEHFNSAFTGYNYFSSPNYPYRDFAVRFGLVWNFFL